MVTCAAALSAMQRQRTERIIEENVFFIVMVIFWFDKRIKNKGKKAPYP
jgi:hypothetical protein